MIQSDLVICTIIFPDQCVFQDPSNRQGNFLSSCNPGSCSRFLFQFGDTSEVKQYEDHEEIEYNVSIVKWIRPEELPTENAKVSPALRPVHVQSGQERITHGKTTVLAIASGARIEKITRIIRALEEGTEILQARLS